MIIREKRYKNAEAIELADDTLSVLVLPFSGGKIQSIRFFGKEYLVQNRSDKFITAEYGASYPDGDFSGFDDMFPTIDACVYPGGVWDGIQLPDHGEVWTLPFEYDISAGSLSLSVYGVRLPYRFSKKITIKNRRLIIDYKADNLSPFPIKHIWAAHPLFILEEGVRLRLPYARTIMNASGGCKYLGESGAIHQWPVSDDGRDMSLLSPKEQCCNKYYIWNDLDRNESIIEYPAGDSIVISCAAAKVPYLGIWVDEMGYAGGSMACVAPEPCTGALDSIPLADKAGKAAVLPPDGELSWRLTIEFRKQLS